MKDICKKSPFLTKSENEEIYNTDDMVYLDF